MAADSKRNDARGVDKEKEFVEKVIRIDRVNKVVKGGKRLAFRAFVIVGDEKGRVGFGLGKAKEVPSAIRKGIERAKKSMKPVNIIDGTLPHEVVGKFGAAKVIMKPARPGTGVIAGGAVRILFEAAGIKDIVAKSLGTSNAINNVKAAMAGLDSCKILAVEEKLRGRQLPVYIGANKKEAVAEEVIA